MARSFNLRSAGASLRKAFVRAKAQFDRPHNKLSTLKVGNKGHSKRPAKLTTSDAKKARRKLIWKRIKKGLLIFGGVILIIFVAFGIFAFAKIQELNAKLPPVEDPFRSREIASVIYDRNGNELYRLFNKFNRDPVKLEEIPHQVRWAFLAAEDSDFYTHQGFDILSIISCTVRNVLSRSIQCGGSTITQQMVKITLDKSQNTIERKISEILMATKVEQSYTKDEILQMYLTVAPFGSNIYGLTSASQFYFGVAPKDLTLPQAAVLASIVQSPAALSPTVPFDGDKERAQAAVKVRQMYVLDQLEQKTLQINDQHRKNVNSTEEADLFTKEVVEAAKVAELTYREPKFGDKKAGHFVDMVISLLQQRNYRNGEEPFTLSDIQTEGLKIYTTLDYRLQTFSEAAVLSAVNANRGRNLHNGSLMLTKPSTGEIFVMVGSADYNGDKSGCDANKRNCLFDPQVNIMTSLQSPGSSTKPFGYYEAYRQGKFMPTSLLPDIPLKIPGYSIQNALSNFIGIGNADSPSTSAQEMLRTSRNLPAIMLVQLISVQRFVETMREFGYSTFQNMSQYGPSVILGGSDIKGVDHAQGYGVFANGGDLVKYEVITKIEDRNGKVLWELKTPERKRVADPQAVYLLNQSLRNNYNFSFDGRDIADKTGTSEDYKDLWIGAYSPDFVVVAWMGNNNNAELNRNTFSANIVVPWVRTYVRNIAGDPYFNQRTSFARPGGIISTGGAGSDSGDYTGIGGGLAIEGRVPPTDIKRVRLTVCVDQPTRIARGNGLDSGFTQERVFTYYVMRNADLQNQFNADFNRRYGRENKIPDQECDVNRSGLTFNASASGTDFVVSGRAIFTGSSVSSVKIYKDSVSVANRLTPNPSVNADGTFSATYNSGLILPGTYTYKLIAVSEAANGDTYTREVDNVTITILAPSSSSSSSSATSAASSSSSATSAASSSSVTSVVSTVSSSSTSSAPVVIP